MALTAAQQSVGCYIANGVLDMAPGGYMTALADVINANGTDYRAITKAVVATSLFTDKYPSYLTNDQFAANYATNLVGTTVSATAMTALKAQIVSQLNSGQSRGDVVYNVLETLYSKPATDADFGAAATSLQNQATVAQYYTVEKLGASTDLATLRAVTSSVTDAASVETAKASIDAAFAGTVSSAALTTGMDNVVGTGGDDSFTARIFDNSNTLQSGDKIAGGGGADTLSADIGNSQKFAITAETSDVETVSIRAQAVATDSTDNNTASTSEVQIDAQRMAGVTQWESNNSRADLLIEDVRILDTQLTKNITIAMVETDPGHVDFGVYFDQYSLRATNNASSTLTLEVMDTRSAFAGTGPLLNNPYNGFKFAVNGKMVEVKSQAIDDAQSYADLKTAIEAAVKAVPELSGFTVALGSPFTVSDTLGSRQSGTTITLTSTKGETVTTPTGSGWVASGAVPPSSGLHTNMSTAATTSTEKVTSKVILDDVGRGSTGGDLVIGGLSVGDTSTSLGVERFEIEVRDNSKLQTINSTNNTLQEVTIKNGVTTSSKFAYVSTEKDKGDLTVNGNVAATLGNSNVDNNVLASAVSAVAGTTTTTTTSTFGSTSTSTSTSTITSASTTATSYGTGIDTALPGSAAQHNAYGFSDVRLIDASAMTGDLAFTAEVTARSIAKYMNLVDTQANPVETITTGNGVNGFSLQNNGSIADFKYTGGAGADKMVVTMDGAVVASRSMVVAGREDFTFSLDGGAGDDYISLKQVNNDVVNATTGARNNPGNAQDWYHNQDLNNNVTVSGGAGNDTIWTPGAGDAKIDGGVGNDVIYTDNTGFQNVKTYGATGYKNSVGTNKDPVTGVNVETTSNVNAVWVFNTLDQSTALNAAPAVNYFGSQARDINDLRSDVNDSYAFYNAKVSVNFLGIPTTTPITVTGTGYKTTDLEINQAIKNAINKDPVLSKLLLAEDGPANSLVVKSLIDGDMSTVDLTVNLTTLTLAEVTALSATELAAVGAAYNIANPTAATVHAVMTAAHGAATSFAYGPTSGDYVTAMANDGAIDIIGANSQSTSDNTVIGGEGDDVIVLGTTAGTTAGTYDDSNEVLVYTGAFGKDVVVNFAGGASAGYDSFDFSALLDGKAVSSVGAASNTDASVAIAADLVVPTGSTLIAEIKKLYTDDATTAGASKHVYVSYDAHNVGKVYQIVDGAAANDLAITELGSIDLAYTNWTALNSNSFAIASKAVNNGGQPAAGTGGGTGTGTAQTVAVTAAGSVTETAATNTTFNVAAGNYTYNIADFGAGDKLVFPSGGVAPTVNNTDYTDGIIDVQFASGGTTTLIHLTGLPETTFASPVFGVDSFNTIFGAGSLA